MASTSEEPSESEGETYSPSESQITLDRLASFRVTYIAIVAFLLLYIFSVEVLETYLQDHFQDVVEESIDIAANRVPPSMTINRNLTRRVKQSKWVELADLQIYTTVVANNGTTFLYIDGYSPPPDLPMDRSLDGWIRHNRRLLPATGTVRLNVPHNTVASNVILISYAAALFTGLFFYNRRIVSLENKVLDEARSERDLAARRTRKIEDEIEAVRRQSLQLEPENREHREEVSRLQTDQEHLQRQLSALRARERELRGSAELANQLEKDGRALEELLEEATGDLSNKDKQIGLLESNLKRVAKASKSGGKAKDVEILAKRMRVLYPTIEIDNRAIEDIIDLQDETIKLKAEECLKRLSEEADNTRIRRRVGGLPNHLAINELGFMGKRRIYYTKGKERRLRVLLVGAKNTQSADMVFLSRISKGAI
jgi:hypothetical protein